MRRVVIAIVAALALTDCDAFCFKEGLSKVCPGDPCSVDRSDEYCLEARSEKLYCARDGMYDSMACDKCSCLYDADMRRTVAVCAH